MPNRNVEIMNILFQFDDPIIPSSGGVERVTDTLTREFKRRGHNVYFLCHQKYDLITSETELSAEQFYLPKEEVESKKGAQFIEDLIEREKINVVISQNPNKIQLQILESIDTSVKKIAVIHTQPYCEDEITRRRIYDISTLSFTHRLFKIVSFIFPGVYRSFFSKVTTESYKDILSHNDYMCLISERFYTRIRKHIPNIDYSKLCAINNPNTFQIKEIDLEEKENYFIWVGRVNNGGKNCIDFLRFFHRFSQIRSDWKAIVVGDGPDLESNKNWVRKREIKNIEFTGNVDNVSDYYKKATYLIVTSWSESWSMVLTEGMAHGCIPIVYDTYETLHDIIDDGQSGFILTDTSPQGILRSVLSTMNDSDLKRKVAINAHKKVQNFNIKDIVDQWIELLITK